MGYFVVERPYCTFRFPSWLAMEQDPFPVLETVTMEKGDVLLSTYPKTGA